MVPFMLKKKANNEKIIDTIQLSLERRTIRITLYALHHIASHDGEQIVT